MPGYRLELATTGRATCKNTECKANQIKIEKGELRFGTLVEIQGNQSWTYKHWGCVTPVVIGNLSKYIEGNLDYLDGYDELDGELQTKVRQDGHVADADWRGDLPQNRPGMKGFRSPAAKKTNRDAEEQDGDESPTKPASRKRARPRNEAAEGEASEEVPVTKKRKGKVPKKNDTSDKEARAPPKRQSKKARTDINVEDTEVPGVTEPPDKKKAAKKTQPKIKMEDDDNFKANVEPSKPQSRKAKPRTKTPPVAVKDEDTAQEDKDVEVTDVKEEDISDHQSGNEAAEEAPLPKRRKKANKGGTKVDEAGKRTNLETSKGSAKSTRSAGRSTRSTNRDVSS